MLKEKIKRMSNIDEDGCWIWTGCVQSNGYARVNIGNRKIIGAHRASYMAFNGDIPDGADVCHKCDVRNCVNPDHLFIGTRKENMEDCVKKGRQAKRGPDGKLPPMHGENTNFHKLKEHQVIEIRNMIDNGVKKKDIAVMFGVSVDNIRRIARRDTWRHI